MRGRRFTRVRADVQDLFQGIVRGLSVHVGVIRFPMRIPRHRRGVHVRRFHGFPHGGCPVLTATHYGIEGCVRLRRVREGIHVCTRRQGGKVVINGEMTYYFNTRRAQQFSTRTQHSNQPRPSPVISIAKALVTTKSSTMVQ